MKRMLITVLLMFGLLPVLGSTPSAASPPTPPNQKIASNLGLLMSLQREGIQVSSTTALGHEMEQVQADGLIEVSARFTHELSATERAQIEALGVEFEIVAGQLAHLDQFYALQVPVAAVDALAAHPLTVWLEATWQPVLPAPLDVSVPASNVPAVWQVAAGPWSTRLTGAGVTIANFDTGVDVHHPAFLDGNYELGRTDWDTCSPDDNVFTPGCDTLPPSTGVLRYWNAQGDPFNTAGFDPTQDWVYLDSNSNGTYEYTELILMAYDADGDGLLEDGESLIPRGTMSAGIPKSKIAATLNAGSVSRTRGVDLESTAADVNGHGTGVAGILVGGNALHCDPSGMYCIYAYPNTRRYTGVAPDADLLVADRVGLNDNYAIYIPWAAGLGANVMLYEYGGWVNTYLDGSSNHEQMIDATSVISGAVQVVPTGNMHGGGRHLQYMVPSGTFNHCFNVPAVGATTVYASMVWLTPGNHMTVSLTTPTGGPGNTVALPCSTAPSGWQWVMTSDGHNVGCERAANSSRGTALYNVQILRTAGIGTGSWTMGISNPSGSSELTNFYIADDATTWSGGAAWVNAGGGVEKHTATWPSTCDTCIGVASYATRGRVDSTPVGAISPFSGRGPRFFDNARVVDVAAPGHYDVIAPESKDTGTFARGKYQWFGGTSAAAPHVAGVAALLIQFAGNSADPAEIEAAIQQGAASDGSTGSTPNDTWGHGKLDAYGALQHMMHDLGDAPDSSNHDGVRMNAYPGAHPGVQANFPTVYTGTTPLSPHGPMHWLAGSAATGPIDSALGAGVSAEGEADRGFDEDGGAGSAAHNISPITDGANGDGSEDGLWPPGTMSHCTSHTLNYGLTLAPGTLGTHYVNVWIDWNRDGDWGDVFTCTTSGDAPEWAVQNQVVPYSSPGFHSIGTPGFLPYQPTDAYDPTWMRITLSEQPAPVDPVTSRVDGRGPSTGYAYGETEDYYLWYPPTAGFQVAATTTCVSYTVAFTNTSTGSQPITYTWDFGDGTTLTTITRTHPTHHYATPGPYRVVLTTTGSYAGPPIMDLDFQWLTVNPSPQAGFTSNSPVPLGTPVVFGNTSTGATTYQWDFGDGIGTSAEVSPTYVYSGTETYTVTLTATNDLGCNDVYQDTVAVQSSIYLPLVLRVHP